MLKFWIVFAMVFILSCLLHGITSSESDCKPFKETDIPSVTNQNCSELKINNAYICYELIDKEKKWWTATLTCHVGFQLAFKPRDPASCYLPGNKDKYRWNDAAKNYSCVPDSKKREQQPGPRVINITTTSAPKTTTGCVPLCIGVTISLIVLTIVASRLYKKFRGSQKALNVQGHESSDGRVSFGYINPVNGETDSRGSYINSTREQTVSSISANCYDYADNVDAGDQYMYAEMV